MNRESSQPVQRRELFRRATIVGVGLFATSLAACSQPAASPTASAPKPAPTAVPAKPTAGAATKPAATTPAKPAETQAPPKPQTLTKAKLAVITGVAEFAYSMIGVDQNIYRDHGIDAEFVEIKDGGTQFKALLAGEIDTMIGGPAAVFPAQEQGATVKIVGGAYPRLNFVMYAQPGISDVTQLVGKSVGTASPGSFLDVLAHALLLEKGVDTDKVTFVNIGSSPAVFQAVAAGKVDAGPSTIDFIPMAQRDKNPVIIADFGKELPDYLRVSMIMQDKDIKDRPQFVQSIVTAHALSVRYGLDHKDAIVQYGVEKMAKEKEAMEFLWDYEYQNRVPAPDAELDPKSIAYTQQLNVDAGQQKTVLPFESVATDQFHKKVVEQYGTYNWK